MHSQQQTVAQSIQYILSLANCVCSSPQKLHLSLLLIILGEKNFFWKNDECVEEIIFF